MADAKSKEQPAIKFEPIPAGDGQHAIAIRVGERELFLVRLSLTERNLGAINPKADPTVIAECTAQVFRAGDSSPYSSATAQINPNYL